MVKQDRPTLILKLTRAGEPQCEVLAVSRIKLDGHGRILYWDFETGDVAAIEVAALESVSIQPLLSARIAA